MTSIQHRRRLAILAIAVLIAVAGCTGAGGGGGAGDAGGAPDVVESGAGNEGGGSFYEDGRRVIIREATMQVQVADFDPAFDQAQTIARRHGGFVAGWDHDIERNWDRGTLEIRVPAGNFTATRNDLAGLGTLERENVRAEDFTNRYDALQERIEDLRMEERELERLLNRTDDVEQARRLQNDLAEIRSQIRELENRRASIERREALSTIRLTIHEPEGQRPPRNFQSAFNLRGAFVDAFYGGLSAIKWVIVFFGYAIPVGFAAVLFGGFVLVWYRLWRQFRVRLDRFLPTVGGPGIIGRLRGRGRSGDRDGPDRQSRDRDPDAMADDDASDDEGRAADTTTPDGRTSHDDEVGDTVGGDGTESNDESGGDGPVN